jgi:hypothetical protein
MRFRKTLLAAVAMPAVVLAGCYVVPVVDPQGNVQYHHYPLPPSGAPYPANYPGYQVPPPPVSVPARLYPTNDLANQTGMISGSVTNMRTDKRGVASAYGNGGTYMQCEYQMNSPVQGAGSCSFSNGARYRLHLGS